MTNSTSEAPPASPSGTVGESRTKAWGFTGMLMILYTINWADKAIYGLVAQPLAEELDMSASQIGLIGSLFFLAFTISGFAAGLINKWLSIRWALVLLALGWAASMLPLVVVASVAVLLVSRVVLGCFEGPSGALVHTALYSWHPLAKRGLPSACIAACGGIAKIVVAPALVLVIAAWGWRAAFVVLAAVGVAWCVAWLLTWRPGPYGETRTDEQTPTDQTDRVEADTTRVPWRRIFLTPTFLGGAAAVFAAYSLVTVVLTWLPSYFEVGLGYSRVQAGAMFAFPSIAGMVMVFTLTSIGDRMLLRGTSSRILRGVVPSVSLVVCGLILVAVPYIGTPAMTVAVVAIGYGFGACVFPMYNSGLSEICPPTQLAGTLGVFLGIMASGGIIAPYLTGFIVDHAAEPAHGYALAFQVMGIVALLAGVLAMAIVNPVRDARRLLGATASADR
ncbi:MAG TPA: MFS transporter [Aldersonia sp.]